MIPDDAELRARHREATALRSRRDCPSAETLGRVAAGELSRAEREPIADHIAACADCADEYRLAASVISSVAAVAPFRPRLLPQSWRFGLATAAVVTISASTGLWLYGELARAREAAERAEQVAAQSRQDAAALRRQLEEASQPQLDLVVADLYPPDSSRGDRGATEDQAIALPADARLFTLILNVAEPIAAAEYSLDILNDQGVAVWRGSGLHMSRFNTFTIALPRRLLPDGRYRFVLKAPTSPGEQVVEEYRVRLQSR